MPKVTLSKVKAYLSPIKTSPFTKRWKSAVSTAVAYTPVVPVTAMTASDKKTYNRITYNRT